MPFIQTRDEGLLITGARRYEAMLVVLFGGRRGALDRRLARASGVMPGERVMDVGCGPGRLTRRLAAQTGPQGEVTGVDPSPPMLELARRRARTLTNCRFVSGTAQNLPAHDGSLDVVVSSFALHHVPEDVRAGAFAEMARVLRPGGRLLIADACPTGRVTPAIARAMAHAPVARRRGPAGPMRETDVRRYADDLRTAGFARLTFTDAPPWTRYVTAVRPA